MQALVPLVLVLRLGIWLELSILASQPSMSANCLLVLSLWQGFDHEQVEKVGLLAVLLLVIGLAETSSQLGSLSAVTILSLKHEIVLKGVPSSGTGVEELWWEEAILDLRCRLWSWIANGTVIEDLVDRTTQKQQQT